MNILGMFQNLPTTVWDKPVVGLFLALMWRLKRKVVLFSEIICGASDFEFPMAPDDKRVLLVEANTCHAEVLSGLAKYLVELGYRVDVLVNNADSADVFCRFTSDKVKVFVLHTEHIGYVLRNKRAAYFKRVVIASYHLYYFAPRHTQAVPIETYFKGFNIARTAPVCMLHDPRFPDSSYLASGRLISLANMPHHGRPSPGVVNSHYFGEVRPHLKSTPCRFTIIGRVNLARGTDAICEACEHLFAARRKNFKVHVVGAGQFVIPEKYQDHIEFHGRMPWEVMFKLLDECDFILAMLDPQNPLHDIYSRKSSGIYNLSLGFAKPILIHEKFLKISNFSEATSVIYGDADGLGEAMLRAVEMSSGDYAAMTSELAALSEKINRESLQNLAKLLS